MYTNEPLIKSGCQYFFNTPSGNVKNLFFYPTIIGDFTYLPGYIKQRSSFDSFLLMFVESGSLELESSGRKEIATAGTIVFLNCYLPHSYGSENGAHVLWFHFDGTPAGDYYNEFYSRNGNVILPSNPHEIKENEETFFVVQTHGVQIAKDVSVRKRWICVFDRWIRTLEYTFVPIKGTSAPPYDSSHKAGRYV